MHDAAKGGSAVNGTVFFDYDGTLHDCMRIYGPAFRTAYAGLVEEGRLPQRDFADDEISCWLGWTVRDMWETFAPGLPERVWRRAAHVVGDEMNRLLSEGGGALFAGVTDALDELKGAGLELAFLSNCGEGYRDEHRAAFGLDRWFDAYYCAGAYPGMEKWEIYARVCSNHPMPHVVVGDRFHDIDVAVRAGIPAIGCAYGFGREGELERATLVVDAPRELPDAVFRALDL